MPLAQNSNPGERIWPWVWAHPSVRSWNGYLARQSHWKLHSTGKGPSPKEKLLLEEEGRNDRQNQQKYGHQPARAGGWLTQEGGLKACAQMWSRWQRQKGHRFPETTGLLDPSGMTLSNREPYVACKNLLVSHAAFTHVYFSCISSCKKPHFSDGLIGTFSSYTLLPMKTCRPF